jgi:ATP-binding cassette subfamily B protein RaxB
MHALNQMQLTRIMVAHRPETINAAERVVALQDGLAVEVRAAAYAVSPALVA